MLKFDGVANNHAQKIKDEFYYVTAMNENYAQPSMPEGVEEDIIKGLYRVEVRAPQELSARVRLLGSGRNIPASAGGGPTARRGLGAFKCGARPASPSLRATRVRSSDETG